MLSAILQFDSMPKIGFAHHFYSDEYSFSYQEKYRGLEIVYVQSGDIIAEFFDNKFHIPENSVFVLFRHLPFKLYTENNTPQSHCTVQAEFDYSFTLFDEDESYIGSEGLILPLVTPSCPETEIIKKILYSIASDIGTSRRENSLSCSIQFLEILKILNKLARKNNTSSTNPAFNITYKIKKYIVNNLHRKISVSDISSELGLTPNYINGIFKKSVGVPIIQYINKEKAKKISELIRFHNISFKDACISVGIEDFSYGRRLFKKQMGAAPKEFLSASLRK